MTKSIVEIFMQDENDLECSYAIIHKGEMSVIIVLKDCECAIFDYRHLKEESKYFRNHLDEDNRMVFSQYGREHIVDDKERIMYDDRYNVFRDFILKNRLCF